MQVFYFMAFGYGYQYVSGILLSVGIDWTDLMAIKFSFGLSAFYLNIDTDIPNLLLCINLIALFLVIFIDHARSQVKKYTLTSIFHLRTRRRT